MATYSTEIPNFSDHTKRLHRNLVAISFIYSFTIWMRVPVHDAEFFGVKLGEAAQISFEAGALALIVYHFAMYWLNARSDIAEGQWSKAQGYLSSISPHLERMAEELKRIDRLPPAHDQTWINIRTEIGRIEQKVAPIADRQLFFLCISGWRSSIEFWTANILALIALLTFISSKTGLCWPF